MPSCEPIVSAWENKAQLIDSYVYYSLTTLSKLDTNAINGIPSHTLTCAATRLKSMIRNDAVSSKRLARGT